MMALQVSDRFRARQREGFALLMKSGLGRFLRKLGLPGLQGDRRDLVGLTKALISPGAQSSGHSLAAAFFDLYETCDLEVRQEFLGKIISLCPIDAQAIDLAITEWNAKRDNDAAMRLHKASSAASARLINQLNLAPRGTERLVRMREDLLALPTNCLLPGHAALDREMESAFAAWFNAGFLELRPIDWDSQASLLEQIIQYEAVHEIRGWSDLRARLAPADRRCYGFFHPRMHNQPLIFVEVALTSEVPGAIQQIINEERDINDARAAKCAIFYSISNCQKGLKGIPFGNHLIKRVVELLKTELPGLTTFATLSPAPGFAQWLAKQHPSQTPQSDPTELKRLAAHYLVKGKAKHGGPADSVARFHLGNGARVEAIHTNADLSSKGMRQSHGVMVNYLYEFATIEANVLAFTALGTIAKSAEVAQLLDADTDQKKKVRKTARK